MTRPVTPVVTTRVATAMTAKPNIGSSATETAVWDSMPAANPAPAITVRSSTITSCLGTRHTVTGTNHSDRS